MSNMSSLFSIDHLRQALSTMLSLASWKTLALVLAIINIKNLPFVWHLRLLHICLRNMRWRPDALFYPNGKSTTVNGKPTHPVFASWGSSTRTPFLESDYNLHKSNSTYFSDLDIARTALAIRLLSPGVGLLSKEIDQETLETCRKEGKPAPKKLPWMYVAVGSVYCSFKREIKPFERVNIQSKAVGWDQKWLYVLSFYLRPSSRKGAQEKPILLATALTKYVVKKGRLTIPPERVLRTSGFLPLRPEGAGETPAATSKDISGDVTPADGKEGLTTATGVDNSLVREVLKMEAENVPDRATLEEEKETNSGSWDTEEWTWERIEQERLRGLKVVEGYSTLDVKLQDEWELQ